MYFGSFIVRIYIKSPFLINNAFYESIQQWVALKMFLNGQSFEWENSYKYFRASGRVTGVQYQCLPINIINISVAIEWMAWEATAGRNCIVYSFNSTHKCQSTVMRLSWLTYKMERFFKTKFTHELNWKLIFFKNIKYYLCLIN